MKFFEFKKLLQNKIKKTWITVSLLTVFIFILFLPTSQNFIKIVTSKVAMFADVLSSVLVKETNSFRSTNNENNLIESPLLTKAAQMKADDMASKGYFSHIAPNGDKPWKWFDKVGYKYSYAGENLAVDFTESEDVVQGWIDSAKHKANLLNQNFTELGIGIAKGIYEGNQTTFVVQFFGKPFNREISTVITNTKNNQNKLTESASKLSTSTSPLTAIATRSDLLDGEVLGTEVDNTNQTNNQKENLIIITVSLLLVIIVILKIFTIEKGVK